jgi:hypothetical protein
MKLMEGKPTKVGVVVGDTVVLYFVQTMRSPF